MEILFVVLGVIAMIAAGVILAIAILRTPVNLRGYYGVIYYIFAGLLFLAGIGLMAAGI